MGPWDTVWIVEGRRDSAATLFLRLEGQCQALIAAATQAGCHSSAGSPGCGAPARTIAPPLLPNLLYGFSNFWARCMVFPSVTKGTSPAGHSHQWRWRLAGGESCRGSSTLCFPSTLQLVLLSPTSHPSFLLPTACWLSPQHQMWKPQPFINCWTSSHDCVSSNLFNITFIIYISSSIFASPIKPWLTQVWKKTQSGTLMPICTHTDFSWLTQFPEFTMATALVSCQRRPLNNYLV